MLHQTDGLSLQSPLRLLTVLVFHLLLTHCGGQSQVIGPPQPIAAAVGGDIILPCHLNPAMDLTTGMLEWRRSDLNPTLVHVRRAGQDLENVRNPSYKGRTSVFISELKHGNISLKLSKVQLSDQGTYECYIPVLHKQASVKLVVGTNSSPVITLAEVDESSSGVVLQCDCAGWYPEPEVLWLDAEGNLLSAGPTETVRGPDDLYTVSSRLTVEKRHSNSFTCRVQQKDIHQIRETQIHVADDFFKVQSSSSPTVIGLAVSLAVCIIFAVVFFVWKWRQNKIKTKRSQTVETDTGRRKNSSESNKSEDQGVMKGEGEPLRTDETVTMESQLERNQAAAARSSRLTWFSLNPWKQRRAEQQRREEAERREEAWKKQVNNLTAQVQKLQDEKQKKESELQQQLDTKTKLEKQLQEEKNKRETAEREVMTPKELKTKLEKQLQEEKNKRETAEREVKKLKEQKTKLERNQADTNRQLQQEKQKREEAQREVETLKNQLESKKNELFQKIVIGFRMTPVWTVKAQPLETTWVTQRAALSATVTMSNHYIRFSSIYITRVVFNTHCTVKESYS